MDRKFILKQISRNLRAARFDKRYTQEYVAEKAETTQRYISNIELEKSDPSVTIFVKICQALEVDPAAILKFD